MDDGVLSILKAADDPVDWECPPGFPWQAEMDRVRSLQGHLESLVAHALVLDDQVQDASYFAELSWRAEPRKVPGDVGQVIVDRASDDMQAGTTALCPRCGIDSVIALVPGMTPRFFRA